MTRSERVECPFCRRDDRTELVSKFGPQIITSQWRCDACGSYFEAVRREFQPLEGKRPSGPGR